MAKKQRYSIRNWSDYNKALASREGLSLWLDEKTLQEWHKVKATGARGGYLVYR